MHLCRNRPKPQNIFEGMYSMQLFMQIHYSPIPPCLFSVYCVFIQKCPCWEQLLHAHSLSITLPETQQHLQQCFYCITTVSLRWPWVRDIYQERNKTKRGKNDTETVCNNLFVKVVWFELANYRQALCTCYGNIKHLLLRAPCQLLPLSKLMLPISPVLSCIRHRRFTVRALNNTNPYTGNYEKIHLVRHKCFIFISSALGASQVFFWHVFNFYSQIHLWV